MRTDTFYVDGVPHNHTMERTIYVNDRNTNRVYCMGNEIGAVQCNSRGHWLPRFGVGIQSELPAMDWEATIAVGNAIDWIMVRHMGENWIWQEDAQ